MQLTGEQLDANYQRLLGLVADIIIGFEGTSYYAMLQDLAGDPWDQHFDETGALITLLGGRRAPAAKGNHHSFEGGWVHHLLEMWTIWEGMRDAKVVPLDEHVTDARILKGIINHDLHKAWRTYRLLSEDPWKCAYAEDDSDKLLESNIHAPQGVHKSLFILQKHGVKLDPIDFNVIINSEGGYGKCGSYWDTVVAKLVYLLDEMSGNVVGRQAAGRWLGHNQTVAVK